RVEPVRDRHRLPARRGRLAAGLLRPAVHRGRAAALPRHRTGGAQVVGGLLRARSARRTRRGRPPVRARDRRCRRSRRAGRITHRGRRAPRARGFRRGDRGPGPSSITLTLAVHAARSGAAAPPGVPMPSAPPAPGAPMRTARMTWRQAIDRRAERHGLGARPAGAAPADAVAAMCGAHAQIQSAGEVSVALRLDGATRQDVRTALLTEHTLVKTYGPRGTVHLLPARDLPMWTGALSALPAGSGNGGGPRAYLTEEQTEQVLEAVADALADAELTTDELTEAIVERTGPWAGDPVMEAFQGAWPRWRAATHLAAYRGVLCFGAPRGRKVTHTSPGRLLPGFRPLPAEQALTRLLTGYLRAYGPATPQSFARWLAAPVTWASGLFERNAGAVQPVDVEGTTAWVAAGDTAAAEAPARGLRLLPYFDAYGVGGHPRERIFPGRASERALARGQAGNYPLLLIDGTVAGVWHQRLSGRRVRIAVEPLEPLPAARLADLDEQVERLGAILGARPELTIGPIPVGPHA